LPQRKRDPKAVREREGGWRGGGGRRRKKEESFMRGHILIPLF